MRCIRIRILSGFASPKCLEFPEAQSEIRIGRAPESEVRLDPNEDKAVTRGVHARLARDDDGGWELECLHASGVGVIDAGGKVVRRLSEGERMPISSGMTFEIGSGGPHLRVEDPNASMVPTEIDEAGAPVAHVPRDVIGKARSSSRRVKVMAAIGLVAVVGVTIGVVAVNQSSRQRTDQVKEETLGQISSVQAESARGLLELREITAAQASVLERTIVDFKGDIERIEERAIDRMDAVLARAARSVWLVGVEDESGGFTPVGTAWTVADRVLATNAHVVEELMSLVGTIPGSNITAQGEGGRLILTNPGQVHPAYARWSGPAGAFTHQYLAMAGGGASRIQLVPPGDVALLSVVTGDPGTPLPLAQNNESGPYNSRGMVVGYAGYPMENIAGLPSIQIVVGRITAVTDYFFGQDPEGENLLIHYDGVTVGGASGSPLLNGRGEVVGIVSAGSMARLSASGGRVPIGLNYAQDAALVRELLDGTSESMQQARDGRWRDRLSEVSLSPEEILNEIISQGARGAEIESLDEGIITLTSAGIRNAATIRLRMEPGHRYIIGAVAHDWTDIDLYIRADGEILAKDDALDWYPLVILPPVSVAREVLIHIVASPPLRSEECRVTVRTARIKVQR